MSPSSAHHALADRAPPERAPRARPETVVGAGVLIRGDIEGVTDLHVHGQVVGKVTVADLTVEDDALIDGPVTADAVTISGRVIGPVDAKTVRLAASARMEGDVTCSSIQIDAGARFLGRCISEEPLDKIVPMFRIHDDGSEMTGAGQELLRLAARLRRVAE